MPATPMVLTTGVVYVRSFTGTLSGGTINVDTVVLDEANDDITLSRGAANQLDLATGDSFRVVSGGIGVGAANTTAGTVAVDTALVVGTGTAVAGALRVGNNAHVTARNAADSQDRQLIGLSTANEIAFGQDGNSNSFRFYGLGPSAFGGAVDGTSQLTLLGAFANGGGDRQGFRRASDITGNVDSSIFGDLFEYTFIEAASGAHPLFASVNVRAATVTAGIATLADTASVYIAGAMTATVTGRNYAGWADAGDYRIDGVFSHGGRESITVDAATTFAITSTSVVLACTGVETINTVTGGYAGALLLIEHTDTECTLADDDDPTASNALDLIGAATNDVGAVNKMIGFYHNGTYWMQVWESDN